MPCRAALVEMPRPVCGGAAWRECHGGGGCCTPPAGTTTSGPHTRHWADAARHAARQQERSMAGSPSRGGRGVRRPRLSSPQLHFPWRVGAWRARKTSGVECKPRGSRIYIAGQHVAGCAAPAASGGHVRGCLGRGLPESGGSAWWWCCCAHERNVVRRSRSPSVWGCVRDPYRVLHACRDSEGHCVQASAVGVGIHQELRLWLGSHLREEGRLRYSNVAEAGHRAGRDSKARRAVTALPSSLWWCNRASLKQRVSVGDASRRGWHEEASPFVGPTCARFCRNAAPGEPQAVRGRVQLAPGGVPPGPLRWRVPWAASAGGGARPPG